jgi:SAM-dependent methyltransferase
LRFVERPLNRPVTRKRRAAADLGASWKEHAEPWVIWARKPGHDSYWRFHRDLFLASVPAAGWKTLDVGCGEGRLSRDLKALGHDVVGVDVSPTMLEAAQHADQQIETHLADAATLPFPDAAFDCVVAFMSLQDIDDLRGATREVQRVLEPRGRFCLAIVHPLNSAGSFKGDAMDSPFVISGSYLEESFYEDNVVRDGLEMTFVSAHRPLHAYTDAINEAGLLIEHLDEPAAPEHAITRPQSRRWQRLPPFLHLRAIRP